MNKPIPELTARQLRNFWRKVDVRGPDDCWPWLGGNVLGYGCVNIADSIFKAPRISMALDGRDPLDLCALHTCDNPPCCNPAHLWAGSKADNSMDKVVKGRSHKPKGVINGQAKLTADDIHAIRSDTRSQQIIGAQYHVSGTQVFRIKHRKAWAHI